MKKILETIAIFTIILLTAGSTNVHAAENNKIQVAILLDTSSSMDGLIEQAKARLWNIVNTLTTLKYKGKTPDIQIALYEYGNDGIRTDDFIRQVTPLTNDLDLISEKLFALTTNGGYEYCGAVIKKAIDRLNWGHGEADMKLIYIAGNEPFTQGNVLYKDAIDAALKKNVYVNTIHCGDIRWATEGMWKDAAIYGKGKFFNIDHNARVQFVETPFDDRIHTYNMKLNDTYIGYGRVGASRKANQMQQDVNARSVSSANFAERAVSKTKDVYKNSSWDLVDMVKEDVKALDKIKKEDLPEELKGKSKQEIKTYVERKSNERQALQKEIADLAKKRQEYIDREMQKKGNKTGDDLGKAINQSVLDLASVLGYKIDE